MTDRQRQVLEAIIECYITTAAPVGSQTVVRQSGLNLSSASVRATMSELEGMGLLYHPHTSAGRIPTDRAYRLYVDAMVRDRMPADAHVERLANELSARSGSEAAEAVLRRAAEVLGIITQELGVAVAPAFEEIVLLRCDLVPVSSDRLLMVFNLQSGAVRTIYVRVSYGVAADQVSKVQQILNERLGGLTIREIRATIGERLRDVGSIDSRELLDIVLAEGEGLLDAPDDGSDVLLGSASVLAEQPEFASREQMHSLLTLTERRDALRRALAARRRDGVVVTIGGEHGDPGLADFTLVTSTYRRGSSTGVIGVLGPTRMPYDKIIGLVEHTGRLVEGLLH